MSNIEVDLVGIDAVCEYIKHSKLKIFYIHKYPANHNNLTVYEYTEAANPMEASNNFREWASIMNKGESNYQPYSLMLTNDKRHEEDEQKEKTNNKKSKIRVVFVFQRENTPVKQSSISDSPTKGYISKEEMDFRMNAMKQEFEHKLEVQRLKDTIEDLEYELDNPEEEGELSGINKLVELIGNKKSSDEKKEPAKLSGITQTDKESITDSIKRLLKHDPQLADHLKKLADCAENNNIKFKMILNLMEQHL